MWNRLFSLLRRPLPTGDRGPNPDAAARALARTPDFVAAVAERVLTRASDRTRFAQSEAQFGVSGVRDYEFNATPADADPDATFDRLRWGGQLVFVSKQSHAVDQLLTRYRDRPEWFIEHEPEAIAVRPSSPLRQRLADLPLPSGLRRLLHGPTAHYFVARKILLDPVHRLTAKHSYDVRLVRAAGKVDQTHATDGYVVLKRVPTLEQAIARLRQTCPPGTRPDRLETIASKLVRKVFPIFLTREAAFLKLLQRDLPPNFRGRTPRVLSMEVDDKGLVRAMSLKWMRQGGSPISQTDFVTQSAELLRALHESVGIMHLDLRLENMLVTDAGVCMIDFGSSVRVGEDLRSAAIIDTLIREMLQASQITRNLERQRAKKLIRSNVFADLPYPPTPAFDLFALATNMTRPHDNPEFMGLIEHDRHSDEALRFSRLRKRILQPRPDDPAPIRTVHDLCAALSAASDRPAHNAVPDKRETLKPVILTGSVLPTPTRAASPLDAGASETAAD